ncbi:A/G-specific adenine glycosylase [Echinicola sediminis]
MAQGLPYFEKFVRSYPTVSDLAQAPIEDVLRLWQGLGYYSRARNLHLCAKQIVEEHEGQFPKSYKELLKLKGVGEYTAAAIASFAYQEPVAVLDGNVFRVLSRYFGIYSDISSTKGKKEFLQLANAALAVEQPDEYNQAIMEFGALQCTPKKAECSFCPLQASCHAYANEAVDTLPVKVKKIKVSTRAFLYHDIVCGEKKVVKTRGPKDIWQGLTDFPLVEFTSPEKINPEDSNLFHELQAFKPTVDFEREKTYKHILSHQKIFSNFVSFKIPEDYQSALEKWADSKGYLFCDAEKLETLGKPQLIVRYLNDKK